MSEKNDFLQFLINEDIYSIDEVASPARVEEDQPMPEPETAAPAVEEPAVVLTSPSKPKHEILILFDNPSDEALRPEDFDYLGKILAAIGRSNEKADFLNVAISTPNVTGYKYVIAFTPNHQLPIAASTQQYMAINLADAQLIVADALNNISSSTELRKKLWGVLKQVFS